MKRIMLLTLCCAVAFAFGCAKQPTVDDVVAKMTAALGGAEKLASQQDRVETWEFIMHVAPPGMTQEQIPEGGMKSPMIITCKRPNKLRFDFQGPDSSVYMASAYNGEAGWSWQMGQTVELSEAELQEWEDMANTWMDGFHNYKEKGYTLELLPNETIDGQEYIVLQSTDKHGNVMKHYVNATTYFLERSVGERLNMAKEKENMTMTLGDWKTEDGIALAHRVAQYDSEGNLVWEATLTKVEFNTGVEDAKFESEMLTAK